MELKVFRDEFNRKESGIHFLQRLTDAGVKPNCINVTEYERASTRTDRHHANYSHTIVIYYWHTEQIEPAKSN